MRPYPPHMHGCVHDCDEIMSANCTNRSAPMSANDMLLRFSANSSSSTAADTVSIAALSKCATARRLTNTMKPVSGRAVGPIEFGKLRQPPHFGEFRLIECQPRFGCLRSDSPTPCPRSHPYDLHYLIDIN